MRNLIVLICAVSAIIPASGQTRIAIENVTVIDGTDHAPRRNATVVVQGQHILAVSGNHTRQSKGTRVIDGSGKFVIPGLWNNDLHAGDYEKGKAAFPSLISYGITTVRDMGAPLDDAVRLRADTASGRLIGPRLYIAGPLMEGPVPVQMPLIVDLFDEEQARGEVRILKHRAVDYVEVDTSLTPQLYSVIADEARRQGLRLVGHIPLKIDAATIVQAYQKNVEHLGGRYLNVLVACSSDQGHFMDALAKIYDDLLTSVNESRPPNEPQFRADFVAKLLDTFDESRAQQLFRLYAKDGVAQTPTLFVLKTLWETNKESQQLSDRDMQFGARIFAKDLEVVGEMKRVGVPILAGTDGLYSQGGESLHSELELLVQAGLTPLQALQSATRDAAEFMGLSKSVGTVEPGKVADLVLLDANPLDDISNTRHINAVLLHGTLFSKDELAAMRSR
ncbi:MAG TPA: amidohydrolase family protein [Terriglobia bacterium]|nr:amidohydrolase family protein [Terriglobia bacterium]